MIWLKTMGSRESLPISKSYCSDVLASTSLQETCNYRDVHAGRICMKRVEQQGHGAQTFQVPGTCSVVRSICILRRARPRVALYYLGT
jgi:hypothetical protein